MNVGVESGRLAANTEGLEDWNVREGKLVRSFEFADFSEAFGFMTRVALVAEQVGHHPEWSNLWSRVDIALTTVDAGGVTALDIEMARLINAING